MAAGKKLLVISHDARLTGAPVLLLHLMRLLKERGYSFHTLVRQRSGPLDNAFREISDRFDFYERRAKRGWVGMAANWIYRLQQRSRLQAMLSGVDVVFSNTITNGAILHAIRPMFKGTVVSYVHELEMASHFFSSKENLEATLALTDHFFVPCEAVKKFLVNCKKVPKYKVSILPYYIPALPEVCNAKLTMFRESSGIVSDFVVGGIGTVGWRKGIDIFITVAVRVFNKLPNASLQFVWAGGMPNEPEVQKAESDIAKIGLGNRLVIIPPPEVNSLFFRNINLLLLSSREDPYPLVVLEAASVNIPTICFDHAGGAPEFVGNNAGKAVDYLDVEAMANAIIDFYGNRDTLQMHGEKALEKTASIHQNKKLFISQVEQYF